MSIDLKIAIGRIAILLFSIGMFAFSCEEQQPDLIGCWTNAYEEGHDIYKGCDSQKFAVSHYRQVYDFRSDGTVNYLVLHPADAHFMQEAKWEYIGSKGEVYIKNLESSTIDVKLKFSVVDDETLKILEAQ